MDEMTLIDIHEQYLMLQAGTITFDMWLAWMIAWAKSQDAKERNPKDDTDNR